MHFIFSNEAFLQKLEELSSSSRKEGEQFLKKLGVNLQKNNLVTLMVISRDSFSGFDILFELALMCEKEYGKTIDTQRMRVVVFKDILSASKSPHLERTNFILIPEENLFGVKDYPELKEILPFA
jgi:hypothetical protein